MAHVGPETFSQNSRHLPESFSSQLRILEPEHFSLRLGPYQNLPSASPLPLYGTVGASHHLYTVSVLVMAADGTGVTR